MCARLLLDPGNYAYFLQHLGRDNATTFVKAVLTKDIQGDIKQVNLEAFKPRDRQDHCVVARKIINEVARPLKSHLRGIRQAYYAQEVTQ